MVHQEDANRPAGNEAVPQGLTEEDLRQGKRVTKRIDVLAWVALALCLGIAFYAFVSVPWDTRMPYDGKYNRNGTGIPMQIAMLPAPVALVMLLRSGRKPDAHHMPKGSRIAAYILCTVWALACIFGQWIMAQGILNAGGANPG